MGLPEKYTLSLLTTENVIDFLRQYEGMIYQWSNSLFGVNNFQIPDSEKLKLFIKETQEYNELKKKLFAGLNNVIIKVEKDKNSTGILPTELIDLRDAILSVSLKSEQISCKFQGVTDIYLSTPNYSNEITIAIQDFIKIETELFVAIQDEFNSIIHEWLIFHKSELNAISQDINTMDNTSTLLGLQAKRIKSHITNIHNIIK